MSLVTSNKLRPMLQRALKSQGTRPMTILSKQSEEEYNKMVSGAFGLQVVAWMHEYVILDHTNFSPFDFLELHCTNEEDWAARQSSRDNLRLPRWSHLFHHKQSHWSRSFIRCGRIGCH